jgi:hypothetical protein
MLNNDPAVSVPIGGKDGTQPDYSSCGGDNMEARIARLEAHVGHIQSDVTEIKTIDSACWSPRMGFILAIRS